MKQDKFVLTDENYYTREADIHYMSCSQYERFCRCEAETMAYLSGKWAGNETSKALLVGQYFHSALESPEAFKRFCQEHFDQVYKTKAVKGETVTTGIYSDFVGANKMIETVQNNPLMASIIEMPGNNEQFMTGEIMGIPWRMKMDKYIPDRRWIIDYKTTADIYAQLWSEEQHRKVSFIEAHNYMMRAAVYGEIERQNVHSERFPTFLILAVSKQEPPDKRTISVNDDPRWNLELEKVRERLPHIIQVKEGHAKPRRCGCCEYCRATNKANRIIRYTDLMPEYRNDIQEYDDFYEQDLLETLHLRGCHVPAVPIGPSVEADRLQAVDAL